MIRISLMQKKLIIISSIIVIAFSIFWYFIYLPNKNRFIRVKSELSVMKNQIREIEMFVDEGKTIEEKIKKIKERHQRLNNLFPQKEEEALKELSNIAKKLNVEIISITPQPRKEFLDSYNKKTEIDGRVCQFVIVSIKMDCLYRDLVYYIETMRKSLPAFISIERLKVGKYESQTSRLNVVLDLNLYLLS